MITDGALKKTFVETQTLIEKIEIKILQVEWEREGIIIEMLKNLNNEI